MEHTTNFGRSVRRVLTLSVLLCLLAAGLLAGCPALAQQSVRIIWLHHSCGQNLIEQGDVREGLTALGYEFYDHGYNDEGLRLADGSFAGHSYDVPGDNTDPDGLAEVFGQPLHDPPDNTFSHLMQYDVIAFKSCFPVSNIASDEQLAEYQSAYRAIRDRIAQYPDKLFITVTQPPQVPGGSNPGEAARARSLANWLQSQEYLGGLPNLVTFDFFGHLAGGDDFLRPEYRMDEYDAHPNERANREIGPTFVSFVDQAIRDYGVNPQPPAAEAHQATEAPQAAAPTEPEPQPVAAEPQPPVSGGIIDDFELGDLGWSANRDEMGSSVACEFDSGMAHGGGSALRAQYGIVAGGWGGCTLSFEELQDWSAGEGLSFWVRSDAAGQRIGLMIFAGDPMAATPFETFFYTSAGTANDWTQLVFPWTELVRAEWADAEGLAEPDPTQILGFGFGLGLDESHPDGVLWVDDIQLATAASKPQTAVEPTAADEVASPVSVEPTLPPEPTSASVEGPTAAALAVAEDAESAAEAPASGVRAVFPEKATPAQETSGRGLCSAVALAPPGVAAAVFVLRQRD
jgi:hypothetical protein